MADVFSIYRKDLKCAHHWTVVVNSQLPEPSFFNEYYNAELRYSTHPNTLFVFGSNLAGIHGAGAAKTARFQHGAKLGHGVGLTGSSYAVPTKDKDLNVLPLHVIEHYVREFVQFTRESPNSFYLTPVGCGLAGYQNNEIAPMFKGVVKCWIPTCWLPYCL